MDCSDHEHSFNLHLDDNVSSTEDDEYSFAKNKIQITYDDDSFAFSNCTATTANITYSDASVKIASIALEECFRGEEEKPQYNYKGPKVMPTRHETPVTILTANAIGTLRSGRIFPVLLDSWSKVTLIKHSCLPKKTATQNLWSLSEVLKHSVANLLLKK
jgi:hypothetical protein